MDVVGAYTESHETTGNELHGDKNKSSEKETAELNKWLRGKENID
ncbi:unnamed protein product [Mesocestoides corti]|uniref:Flavodoxin n=1 Tax=Mesocestoides corti TaxID=53468 RepID=A0A0R3U2I1_MESCO|nr:unnamed protein product [Mesocestoides corti]